MSLSLHFLNSHLDYFSENLGDVIEGMSERFHREVNIKEMERRCQGRWDTAMMTN